MSAAIHSHRWHPSPGSPTRSRGIYLVHGLGEHGARYERLARRLIDAGWPVVAHDHPGHGRSEGPRGRHHPPGAFAIQVAMRVAAFAAETGAAPYVLGHSLGGVVAAELVLVHRLPVSGLILSAPAILPRLGLRDRCKLRVLSLFAPTRTLELPYDPTRLTHDEHEITAARADRLIHGFRSAELVNALLASARLAIDAAPSLNVAALVLVAGDDRLIDTSITRRFVERLPQAHTTFRCYDGAHHELLNETPDIRDRVMDDIVDWLERIDGMPGSSGG